MNVRKDLQTGAVSISGEAIAEIVSFKIDEIEGVSIFRSRFRDKLEHYLGISKSRWIKVITDDDQAIDLEINVVIKLGYHILDVSKKVQQDIKAEIEGRLDMKVKAVNLNILRIERGTQ